MIVVGVWWPLAVLCWMLCNGLIDSLHLLTMEVPVMKDHHWVLEPLSSVALSLSVDSLELLLAICLDRCTVRHAWSWLWFCLDCLCLSVIVRWCFCGWNWRLLFSASAHHPHTVASTWSPRPSWHFALAVDTRILIALLAFSQLLFHFHSAVLCVFQTLLLSRLPQCWILDWSAVPLWRWLHAKPPIGPKKKIKIPRQHQKGLRVY